MAKRSFRRIIAKRLVNVALTCLGIMILNFMLIHFMPGDPINNVIPHTSKFDPSLKWELREKFHLNDSLPEQLEWYLWNTFTGDWGTSYMQNQRKVIDIIGQDLRWTFLVMTSGKPAFSGKRICAPKTENVPVPVRSALGFPCSKTCRSKSRY